jgi:glucosamine-6-phosphate deaminase
MEISIHPTPILLGKTAGTHAGTLINAAIDNHGEARIILATGASQFDTLNTLVEQDIDWSKVTMFHLDEYLGIDESHPASFVKYLKERFVDQVGTLKAVHLIDGMTKDPADLCATLEELITASPIDVALIGIGENGHLAFNDPPADFKTQKAYLRVTLDEACRMQQVGEGWFTSMDEVPKEAISMSVHQIMASKNIICSVPDQRKAQAVAACMQGDVQPEHPASILQNHDRCTVYLDEASASLLNAT